MMSHDILYNIEISFFHLNEIKRTDNNDSKQKKKQFIS